MTEDNIVAEYDPTDIDEDYYREEYLLPKADDQEEREKIESLSEEEVRNKAVEDRFFWEQKWDDFVRQMGRVLRDISKRNKFDGYFVATANDLGWRNEKGGKVIDISQYDLSHYEAREEGAEEFVQKFNMSGDVTFRVHKKRNQLRLVRYHHDSPQGETFVIRPLRADEVRDYDREGESAVLDSHKESGVHP